METIIEYKKNKFNFLKRKLKEKVYMSGKASQGGSPRPSDVQKPFDGKHSERQIENNTKTELGVTKAKNNSGAFTDSLRKTRL